MCQLVCSLLSALITVSILIIIGVMHAECLFFTCTQNTHQFLQYALVTVCIIIMEIVSGVSGVVEFLKVVSLQNYS